MAKSDAALESSTAGADRFLASLVSGILDALYYGSQVGKHMAALTLEYFAAAIRIRGAQARDCPL
jgi:hypothetical protein